MELKPGKSFAPEQMAMAQMALRWILDFDAVSVVIPGARNISQIKANAAASEITPLGFDLHLRLKDFYETRVASHIRGPY